MFAVSRDCNINEVVLFISTANIFLPRVKPSANQMQTMAFLI